jgi:tRNA (guanine37-N1)-methyltransferase
MIVKIFTLFPEMFINYLNSSIIGRAVNKQWQYEMINIRDYSKAKHKHVDDVPFGGGEGMIIKPDVVADAIDDNCKKNTKIYYMSPRGELLKQEKIKEVLKHEEIAIVCGRYEGLDQRVIDYYAMEELSIGDYILTGGELPAMVFIDVCVRSLEQVIKKESLENESFSNGLLEYPLYTQPREWRGAEVPEILLGGHHKNISDWKLKKSEEITKIRRPDLWKKYQQKTKTKD